MLKTQITGAKYLSPQTNQMTNLNIAVPADSKDTEFGTSDILLAKDVVKLGENSPQIQAIKENIDNVNNTLNDVNSDMQELKNKVSKISTELFKIVTELPEAAYVEYIAIEEDNVWKWEKIGEFYAKPDLSGYAKLFSPKFTGNVEMFHCYVTGNFKVSGTISKNKNNHFFKAEEQSSADRAFATDGSIQPIGTEESFTFTLEDGTTVTKSIRVISTTSQAGA